MARVVYYALQVRHQTNLRQTDLVTRLSTYVVSRDFLEAVVDILEPEFEDYGDFVREYGKPFSKKPIPLSRALSCKTYFQSNTLRNSKITYDVVRKSG